MANFIERIIEEETSKKLKFRFSPENNGYLHIGHAKSICLNFGLALRYNAECNLRFDDTNPDVEKIDFIDPIINDIKWLGFEPSKVLYASDYYDKLYDLAKILIKNGDAYVCELSPDELSKYNGLPYAPGIESPYRNRTILENLLLFEKMKNGEFKEGSAILRAKIDMDSSNMIMRDPVLYRIKNNSHYKLGNNWCVYPMYDYAHPISDCIENISNSLCTMEFESHREFYDWIINKLHKFILTENVPKQTEFARLNIDWTIMSKRKLKKLVEEGFVSGWDDPRLPTISGLRRRGFTPGSIKEFCDRISVTRNESVVSYGLLEECLRNDLNKISNRVMGVLDPIKLVITNWDKGSELLEIENNPEDSTSGSRLVNFDGDVFIESEDFREEANNKYHRLKLGGEVRLKGAYVVKANSVVKDSDGNIKEVHCTYDPDSRSGKELGRKIKGTIHWVSCSNSVKMNVNEYDKLFLTDSPDKGEEDFISHINPNSLVINSKAVFELGIKDCKVGVPVQMMRKGYYVLDTDGKSFNKTVSLKESWNG